MKTMRALWIAFMFAGFYALGWYHGRGEYARGFNDSTALHREEMDLTRRVNALMLPYCPEHRPRMVFSGGTTRCECH